MTPMGVNASVLGIGWKDVRGGAWTCFRFLTYIDPILCVVLFLQVREEQTPLKSLEEIKTMFQRLSFSPFSALSILSPPQIKVSPHSLAHRMFAPSNSTTDESESSLEGTLETSGLSPKPDLSSRVMEGNSAQTAGREAKDDDGARQDAEDLTREEDCKSEADEELLYEAESPDEAALVHAAQAYCCTLRGRSAESLTVDLPGIGSLSVPLLHILPFDSDRKKMSVVVRHPLTGQVVVYTKGADSAIMDLTGAPTGCYPSDWELKYLASA